MMESPNKVQCFFCLKIVAVVRCWFADGSINVSGAPHENCKEWGTGFSLWVHPTTCTANSVAYAGHEPGPCPRNGEKDVRERVAGFRCGVCGMRAIDGASSNHDFIFTRWVR
jgi:hypothetical protein